MKRFRTGLVVGKFCPLHLGHEHLIGSAIEACDEVIVISYTLPEFAGYGAERREGWLRARFPTAIVLVATPERVAGWFAGKDGQMVMPPNDADAVLHRRFVGLLCLGVLGRTVDAVFTSEDYGDGLARELEAFFAERGRGIGAVVHVAVDPARTRIPVSGTELRRDVHAGRRFLAPEVYASFVRRIAILGGESTGKSTLAAGLASRHGTRFAAEYGRERWMARGGRLEFEDLLEIAEMQCAREETEAGRAMRLLFCDTTPLTTLFYSRHLFGRADPRLEALTTRRYDTTLLCAGDFSFVQDGTRDPALRERQQRWYRRELAARGTDFTEVGGGAEERLTRCDALLSKPGG